MHDRNNMSAAETTKANFVPLHPEQAHIENLFIGISGLIGAGKTTLAEALAAQLNLPVYYEPVIDNAYLADFYQDQKRYAFPLQIYLLNRRFRQQQQIIWSNKGGVQDRTIYEDSVFARMLYKSGMMDQRDYETYISLFGNMSNFMRKPNLIVHLDVKPEESLERIKMRSRNCETTISVEYLRNLYDAYEEFIEDVSKAIPVLRIDYSRFRTAEEMAEVIRREYLTMYNIRTVSFDRSPSPAVKGVVDVRQ